MSKPNPKLGSTFSSQSERLPVKTPPKQESNMRRTQKQFEVKKKIDAPNLQEVLNAEKDQRYRYLLKHGELKKTDKNGGIIFVELAQLPNVWVCYRRPGERVASQEKLNLDNLQLNHVPLMEGEEALKMLTFQNNRITKIQNFISLPHLLYIDLSGNSIRELEKTKLPTLKVLLLSKNLITTIKNLSDLPKLEVLDLHSNQIAKIQNLDFENSLRVLNLAFNKITLIEGLEALTQLTELNLKGNQISTVEGLNRLVRLEKLTLMQNKIQSKFLQPLQFSKLLSLRQLTLDENPCCKDLTAFIKGINKHLPALKLFDGKAMQPRPQTEAITADQKAVFGLIMEQWVQEKERILHIEASKGHKKDYIKATCISGGHAQIEDETILFVYGNSYETVLANPTFQETVEKIRFEYIYIEFLIEPAILGLLRKFRRLKMLQFRENYIQSLLQVAKLENIHSLRSISIEPQGNPISSCSFLREFITYRFTGIVQINREDIKESDRARAKQLFNNFDQLLELAEKINNASSLRSYETEDAQGRRDKNYVKFFNRVCNETSDQIAQSSLGRALQINAHKQLIHRTFEEAVKGMIAEQIALLGH